jgi:hypothetical protein
MSQQGDLVNFFGDPGGFDAHSVEPQEDFNALPPGKYPILIEKAEMKRNSKGTGSFLAIAVQVLGGPLENPDAAGAKGRKFFDNLNIDNPNAQCVQIAKRSLAALCLSLGIDSIQDTSQLLNGTCIACVKVKGGQNEIRTYEPIPAVQADAARVATAVTGQPAATPPMDQPAPVTAPVDSKPIWNR